MATFSASVLTSAGSTTLAIASIVGNGTVPIKVREIKIDNQSASNVDLILGRMSTAGTPGSSATAMTENGVGATATATVKGTYTVAGTQVIGGRRTWVPAGNTIIWALPDGIEIPAVANSAVGIYVAAGTGQICGVTFTWQDPIS